MLSLDFSERSLEVQRGVVMEEFKQRCLNQPYGDVGHLLRPLAYQTHPYQWPTIGKELSHIANATLEEVKAFFFRFYAPNNAILAVTGNISFEEAVALTENGSLLFLVGKFLCGTCHKNRNRQKNGG